jgi:hypothetical protein
VSAFRKGDRVRVVADTEVGYHYLPAGTEAVVVEEPRPDDVTVEVRTIEAITSTGGNDHNAGFKQIVPEADLLHLGLPNGYRWATAEETERADTIVVALIADASGTPYTEGEADLAVPITEED